MPTFVESCNCRGDRPKGIVGRDHVPRPDAIARLLRDRSVARFVIAPSGFGKSSIAYEYAHLVFAFKHVFWIRGSSPCFLRDLDAMSIQEGIVAADPSVRLVVFDDVPHLDLERSKRFRDLIDALIRHGCEVVVLATPAADTFSMHELDASILRSRDLLLDDDEVAALETPSVERGRSVPPSARVACLCWGEDGEDALLRGLSEEALPVGMRAAILAMLALGAGSLEDAFGHVPSVSSTECMALLDADYCFLGVDERAGTFEAIPVSVECIARHLAGDLEAMARARGLDAGAELVACLAERLLQAGRADRACTLMRTLANREACAAWVAEHAEALIASSCLCDAAQLCAFARSRAKGRREAVRFVHLVCAHLMGCAAERERILRGLASADLSDRGAIWMRGLLRFLCGDGACADDARSLLVQARSLMGAEDVLDSPFGAWARSAPATLIATIGEEGGQERHAFLGGTPCQAGRSADARASFVGCIIALRYAGLLEGTAEEDADPGANAACEAIRAARRWLRSDEASAFGAAHPLAWHWACGLLERLGPDPSEPIGWSADPDAQAARGVLRMRIEAEGAAYERHLRSVEAKRTEFRVTHPDPFRKGEPSEAQALSMRTATPMLSIRLFGGMSVAIAGEPIDPRALGARKVRTVLAVLAVNGGKEVSKARMASVLWPEEGMAKYRRNFYNLWSKLKKALSVNGVCPYLIRTQSGCRLDERYVTCDVDAFDEVCRSMLFGFEDPEDWERVYSRVVGEYADDLMPGDVDCEFLNGMREQYRSQLVDGLISASRKLLACGIPEGALWFAREAMRRDDRREDGYIALMEAQIASDQRGYAIRTYFDCRRFLSEELGIDPSVRVVDLYRSIIEAQEQLV